MEDCDAAEFVNDKVIFTLKYNPFIASLRLQNHLNGK